MSHKNLPLTRFDEMNLSLPVFSVLQDIRYNMPTPIQARTIPLLIEKKDVLGQARTGTGKTAAFALPLLSRINPDNKNPQVLVLTPTRELAIQVGESFKTYGANLKGLNVLSVYGGQGYGTQLNQLRRGAHVLVGTPGRLMDHMRRKAVSFENLFCVVLDEADEMLHMGFIEDVEWIMDRIPENTQTALFSATMPKPIRAIAQKYLKSPEEILVQPESKELSTIKQQYLMVKGVKKGEALVRILEATSFDGVIVFVKTKTATLEVTKILEDKGFKTEALNGDIAQNTRERTINRLKTGHIDILVATDVAARGLDVDRISHVINYDMPSKVDPYVHRIGRTGRAGREGEAILFVGAGERWMLNVIEKTTRQKIEELVLPSNRDINERRIANFKKSISGIPASTNLDVFQEIIETHAAAENIPISRIAAALAGLLHGSSPFLLPPDKQRKPEPAKTEKKQKTAAPKKQPGPAKAKVPPPPEKGMERYRIEVGLRHGVKPKNIVGAISNEAGLDGRYIKNIDINQDFSFVDLPFGMPKDIFALLKKTWVMSKPLLISKCA